MHAKLKPMIGLLPLLFTQAHAQELLASLDTVTITATRQAQKANEAIAEVTVIDKSDIEQAGAAATLGELLARTAGIELSRSGPRGADESIFIRGTNGGHTLVLVDGVRVGSATTGTTALQMLPLAQVERIEILRGPGSALYGSDAIGGVIQIFTKTNGDAPRLVVQAGAGNRGEYETSIAHQNRIGQFNYSIKAGAAGGDGINTILSPNYPGYNPDRDGYRKQHLNLNLNYAIRDNVEIGAGYFTANANNQYDAYQYDPGVLPWGANVNAGKDYRMKHRTSGAYAFLDISPTRNWKSSLRIGQGEDRTESPESVIGDPISLFKTTQKQYAWQNDIRLPLGTLLVAAERLEQEVDSTKDYASKSRSINSGLLGWNATIGAHSVQANLRADKNSQFGHRNTWLLGYGYQILPGLRLAASHGTAFKAPTMNELYFPTTPGVGGGNPALRPEESKNTELALRYKAAGKSASLTYFRNRIENLIEWTTHPVTYYSTPANVGQVDIEGVELGGGLSAGNWTFNGHATYQDVTDLETGQQLRRRARAFGTLSAIYASGPFRGGVEWKLVGKRQDDPHWQTRQNQVKMSGYTLLNLFAEYEFARDWKLHGRIDNLFDRDYETAKSTNVLYATPGLTAFAGIRYTFK